MDLLRELGPLGFASRLRRISDNVMGDINKFFRENRFGFQTRWSNILFLLKNESPLTVSMIAERLGMTHTYVVRLSQEMKANKLIKVTKDSRDARRKFLHLSDKGRRLVPRLERHWKESAECQRQLIQACKVDIMEAITQIEDELDNKDMYHRLIEQKRGK